ncbi:hypothetical protein T281_10960 [Rhodomicrobium udaipurense JA643]|uniref:Phasin domain-containing protein n=1 Tax=Rhodomicrobium udaipurense TaxID=1202716 RepID=A0A8I1GFV3_9HYPH|nr:hypothetical protein [Rhodomicrobium udaipurense]KAI94439.1 hypothetical protein T281_10960 [Rhodomicrobium udaipurense JA643]MBJ7543863.1 hypothetical protein [Rhodomicrobium udaipurense]
MQQSPQPSTFDLSPVLKAYVDSIDIWKKNYENIAKSAREIQGFTVEGFGGNGAASASALSAAAKTEIDAEKAAYDNAVAQWQKSGDDLFKRLVQNQVELCRFFGSRWEQYLSLPDQVAQCRTVAEFGNLQQSFLTRFASDYMQEGEKLAQPFAEYMASLGNNNRA